MKIAINGPMCSGKSTIANIIKEHDDRYSIYSFGGRVKELAFELFGMRNKDRSLLINIASKMREIDEDVWAKCVVSKTKDKEYCIVDDLRFQNELDHLKGWTIISLTTPTEIRVQRIKAIYKHNYEDHLKNMTHASETGVLNFPEGTIYIDGSMPYDKLKKKIIEIIS